MGETTFLTELQQHHVRSGEWTPVPNGAYLDLYPEDFDRDHIWEQICDQLQVPVDSKSVTILYFGTKHTGNEVQN